MPMPSTTGSDTNTEHESQHQQHHHPHPDESSAHRLQINTYHCRFCSHLLLATTRDLDSLPRRRSGDDATIATGTGATESDMGGIDRAIILPLPVKKSETTSTGAEHDDDDDDDDENDENDNKGKNQDEQQKQEQQQKQEEKTNTTKINHITILLSTIIPSFPKTLIRRADGFEKRLCLRCGRCRVVMGYFLDPVHFPEWAPSSSTSKAGASAGDGAGAGDGEDEEEDVNANVNSNANEPKVVYILPGALVETGILADGNDEKIEAKDGEWKGWLQE